MRTHPSGYELINKIINISSDFDCVDIQIVPKEGIRVINNPYNHVQIEDMYNKFGFSYTGKSSIGLGRIEFVRFFKNTAELRKWIDSFARKHTGNTQQIK
jgi:hypothetical protein